MPHDLRSMASLRIKRGLQPLQLRALDQHRIKAAARQTGLAGQPMPGRQHDTPALDSINAASCAAMGLLAAAAYFHKHHHTVAGAQNQVYLATAAAWRPIIALYQPPAPRLCMLQGRILGQLARRALRGGQGRWLRLFSKETH